MKTDLSKIRRYELKYTIDPFLAEKIRDYIQPVCSLDEHAAPETGGYRVNNLYFDTPDLRFYYDTKHRKLDRFKPRVRYYGDAPEDWLWLELKHKHASIVWKNRRRIPLSDWPQIMQVGPTERLSPEIKDLRGSFEEWLQNFDARPTVHVRYWREPYVSDLEEYGRVTFDWNLSYRLAKGSSALTGKDDDMVFYDDPVTTGHSGSPVILEIKTLTLVPAWVIGLIRRFNLMQRGFSKYCYGIDHCTSVNNPDRRFALDPVLSAMF